MESVRSILVCFLLTACARASLPRTSAVVKTPESYPSYQELYYNQTLDHFDPTSATRWSHRYLLNSDNWDGRGELANGCKGPILLYAGNEGPIEAFWSGNGFMIEELAPQWGALLVFPEQRFYGKSMPFGDSPTAEQLKFLTTAQVLADYAEFVADIKSRFTDAASCPVVAFGGSYGGTLAALLRAAHPATVVGSLAASSELGYYDMDGWAAHGVDAFAFEDIVAKDYDEAHPDCLSAIQAATAEIAQASESDLVEAFHVCDASVLGPSKTDFFVYALEALPQQDYPYQIGAMPAKPVNEVCNIMLKAISQRNSGDASLIKAAAKVTDFAFGYSGSSCIKPYGVAGPGNTPGDGPGLGSWGWQSCSETMHSFSARTLRNYTFSFAKSATLCSQLYNSSVAPSTTILAQQFGGYALAEGTAGVHNIIWSQGTLDPWHGWFKNMREPSSGSDIHHFLMKGSAHHLDLRTPNAADPPDVKAARAQMKTIIRGWIDKHSVSAFVV